MNLASHLSRYFLAGIFIIELTYKVLDWSAWVGQFTSLLPFALPWNSAGIASIIFAILEGLVALSLILGKEKFITGWIAAALLLGILISFQRITIAAGAYSNPLLLIRGFLQDPHLWMMLAAGIVVAEGWEGMKEHDA